MQIYANGLGKKVFYSGLHAIDYAIPIIFETGSAILYVLPTVYTHRPYFGSRLIYI
jgi:hypothetical protein